MKKQPLMLILLPIVLFLFFYGIETRYHWKEKTVSAEESVDEKNTSEKAVSSQTVATEKEIPDNYIKMTLVIGQTGTLKGGKEIIYSEPDINSEMAGNLEYNCAVLAKDEQSSRYSDEWVYVDLLGAGEGYVKKNAVKIVNVAFGSENPFYHEIIKTAISYMGAPFTMNGDSLTEGIDCSHFAAKMFEMNGLEIPNKPLKQRKEGILINPDDRQPGDIIFYDKANNGSGHVGIYLGEGYVDNPDEFEGGFIINSTGHSGKKYPEGGVRIVCIKYPDRDHYEVVRFIPDEEAGGNDE